ncbi:hypothetical protein CN481_15530 [Bacillus sp. AFS006103]|nr:hypothetical protein CN481_15530 [Bacillus sp. AFS006103]
MRKVEICPSFIRGILHEGNRGAFILVVNKGFLFVCNTIRATLPSNLPSYEGKVAFRMLKVPYLIFL